MSQSITGKTWTFQTPVNFNTAGGMTDQALSVVFNEDLSLSITSQLGLPATGYWANDDSGNGLLFTLSGNNQETPTPWVTVCSGTYNGINITGCSCEGVNSLPSLPGVMKDYVLS